MGKHLHITLKAKGSIAELLVHGKPQNHVSLQPELKS